MKTDDLIAALAADDNPSLAMGPRLFVWLATALVLSAGLALAVLGLRGNLWGAMTDPVTALKWLMPLLLAGVGLGASRRMTSPLAGRLPERWLLIGVVLAAGLMLVTGWVTTPEGQRWVVMRGNSLFICLGTIIAVAIPPLLAVIHVLGDGASPRPRVSGAMIGLGVGGLAAAAYALHCDEDAPLFFLTWYGAAILSVSVLGAVLGARQLRW